MNSVYRSFLTVLTLFISVAEARADLTITPTFDSSITNDPNHAVIESTIDTAISNLEGDIANNVNVNITFSESTSVDLGENNSTVSFSTYSSYLSQLETKQTLSAADVSALASLPNTSTNPVNGGSFVQMTTPLLRALGNTTGLPSDTDGTITFNQSEVDEALGTPSGGQYSLESVVTHEMDEVLGAGGAGSTIGGSAFPPGFNMIGPLDLFRYSAPGVRSFTSAAGPDPYFSIDGGKTKLVYFNQTGVGDYADWGNGITNSEHGNNPTQVQDAFGEPNTDPQLGANEMAALDVIGWNLTPAGLALEDIGTVPEPSTYALLLGGLLALGVLKRSRSTKFKKAL